MSDKDLTSGFTAVEDCESACNGRAGCIAVNWHGSDKHCHVLSGKATHAQFVASLQKTAGDAACMLVKK